MHPTRPVKNKDPTGGLVATGNRPSASSFFLYQKLFWECEWGLYVVSSHTQANKYVKRPLRPGSCSLDTEVTRGTIRCHLERAGTRRAEWHALVPRVWHILTSNDRKGEWSQPADPHWEQRMGKCTAMNKSLRARGIFTFSLPQGNVPLECIHTPKLSIFAMNQACTSPRSGISWF